MIIYLSIYLSDSERSGIDRFVQPDGGGGRAEAQVRPAVERLEEHPERGGHQLHCRTSAGKRGRMMTHKTTNLSLRLAS